MDPEKNMVLYRVMQVVVLTALAPFWYPIAKAMWRELYAALLPEGGLFGSPPTEIELERLQQKLGDYEEPLVSEPWARDSHARPRGETGGGGRAGRGRTSATTRQGSGSGASGRGPAVSSGSGGFRRARR